jgi:hypothetical protein
MDNCHFDLGRRLIASGTIMIVSALLLVALQNWLSAGDVQHHRLLASSILQENGANRATLSEWEPPSHALSWTVLVGGFAVIVAGIRIGSKPSGSSKVSQGDQFA